MTDKLTVYNNALNMIGARALASLTEDREPRRALDAQWSTSVAFCLEQAMWIFALRTVQLDAAALPAIPYGFEHAFTRPEDCIYTYMLSPDTDFDEPNRDFLEADGLYFGRGENLFLRYTSNDVTNGGLNLAKWTSAFSEFVSTYLASQVCFRLTRNLDLLKALVQQTQENLMITQGKDAVANAIGPIAYNAVARREYSKGGDIKEPFPFVPMQPQASK